MPDYELLYFKLFNKITDAVNILHEAQSESEEFYVESRDALIHILSDESIEKK